MSGNQQTGIIFDRALRRGTTYDWSYISRPHPVTAPILFVSRDLFSDDPNGMGGRDSFCAVRNVDGENDDCSVEQTARRAVNIHLMSHY